MRVSDYDGVSGCEASDGVESVSDWFASHSPSSRCQVRRMHNERRCRHRHIRYRTSAGSCSSTANLREEALGGGTRQHCASFETFLRTLGRTYSACVIVDVTCQDIIEGLESHAGVGEVWRGKGERS